MKELELGLVIAKRQLELQSDGKLLFVTVLMGAPQEVIEDGNTHSFCPIQIIGIGDEKVRAAWGVDAFQALQLGLQLIGVELYVKLNPKVNHGIRWNGETDLSFPLPDSVKEFGPKSEQSSN